MKEFGNDMIKNRVENLALTYTKNHENLPFFYNNTINNPFYEKTNNDIYINKIFNQIRRYEEGDLVHTYLKSIGITKHNEDTYIYKDKNGQISMVNLCYKFEKEDKTGKYRRTGTKLGLQQIILTKDANGNFIKDSKQWYLKSPNIENNPFVLEAIGENNGFIYVTEGIENALSLRECGINNEIWCVLSLINFHLLPFSNDVNYIFFLNNNYKNEDRHGIYDVEIIVKLKEYGIDNKTKYNSITKQTELLYNEGDLIFKSLLFDLKRLNNKHISYIIPQEIGYSANNLLMEKITFKDENGNEKHSNKLAEFLEYTAPIPIEIESSVKINKTGTIFNWMPTKSHDIKLKSDKLTVKFITKRLGYTCSDVADRFALRFGDLYKNVNGVGICKYNVEKGIYIKDSDADLKVDIRTTIRFIYFEYFYLLKEDERKAFKKFWEVCNSYNDTKLINDIVDDIKTSNIITTAEIDNFDNYNIINLVNGYYDLENNKFYPHTKDKLFFKMLDIKYREDIDITNPNADWNKFLTSMFYNNGNNEECKEKIRFLQKAMGYTFSNSTAEEKIFIVKGVTRSGKSTFLETIQSVMSDYCGNKQSEDFITQLNQTDNYILDVLASLQGKRFVHISEISNNKKLNGTQIKRLAGDKYITGKHLYKGVFSYKNQAKFWIGTNSIDFTEYDDSVKTKLFIINFDKRFYEAGTKEAIETGCVIDKTLKTRLLSEYNKEFVLKWIIEGYALYKKEGLTQTKEMFEELEIYDNNNLNLFIKEMLIKINPKKDKFKNDRKTARDIYDVYVQYEYDNFGTPQEQVISYNKFLDEIRKRQIKIERRQVKLKKSYYLVDWCLKDELIAK